MMRSGPTGLVIWDITCFFFVERFDNEEQCYIDYS